MTQRKEHHVVTSHHGSGTRAVVHQGKLAKRVALRRHAHQAPPALARNVHLAFSSIHDVEVVSVLALRDDGFALLLLDFEEGVHHRVQLVLLQVRKKDDASEGSL